MGAGRTTSPARSADTAPRPPAPDQLLVGMVGLFGVPQTAGPQPQTRTRSPAGLRPAGVG